MSFSRVKVCTLLVVVSAFVVGCGSSNSSSSSSAFSEWKLIVFHKHVVVGFVDTEHLDFIVHQRLHGHGGVEATGLGRQG